MGLVAETTGVQEVAGRVPRGMFVRTGPAWLLVSPIAVQRCVGMMVAAVSVGFVVLELHAWLGPVPKLAHPNAIQMNAGPMVAGAIAEFVRQPQSARQVLAFLSVLRCVAGMNAVTMVAVGFAETVEAVCPVFWDLASMSANRTALLVSVG